MDDEKTISSDNESDQSGTHSSKRKVNKPNKHRKLIYGLLSLLVLIILLGSLGYGIYEWQHHKVTSLDVKTTSLNHQVSSLNSQLASTKSALAAAKAEVATDSTVTPTSKQISACTTDNLSLSLGQPNGSAGTSFVDLILTNTSSTTCTLTGYPSVILVNGSGQQLGQTATQSTSASPTTITLQPNQTAHSAAGFPDSGNFSSGTCSDVSTDINLTPPGQTAGLQAASVQQWCPGFSVTAFQSGN